ncbi:hypothetical protein [Pseudodesulfovibrio tunisiensis]|uniref:hypothetical protein n=1 Tax=Pseudodesulfovibrio tunisiensis TaxID=463192 RepID=UPI001FB56B34|nr:hypothetical protein [Pseudodesulfovibrio tunisiensis]
MSQVAIPVGPLGCPEFALARIHASLERHDYVDDVPGRSWTKVFFSQKTRTRTRVVVVLHEEQGITISGSSMLAGLDTPSIRFCWADRECDPENLDATLGQFDRFFSEA